MSQQAAGENSAPYMAANNLLPQQRPASHRESQHRSNGRSAPATYRNNIFAEVPEGWTTAVDPNDGRMYYLELSTGRTSYAHPYAGSGRTLVANFWGSPSSTATSLYHETPSDARHRPDNHQCEAVLATVLFPPLGIFALFHSIQVDRCWAMGAYSASLMHSRQAPNYASCSIFIGIIMWIYLLFFRERDFQWPNWNLFD